ncbi:MAG: hypothetical protein ACEQSU_11795 [Microgenomates group bacterium]
MTNTINEEYTKKTNMKKLTAETNTLWQYQKLIMACSHFESLEALDARSFSITLNIQDGKQVELIKPVYFSLLKEFCGGTYVIGSHRPAMIIEDDIGGTKWGKGRDENHHFHALLVQPQLLDSNSVIEQDIESKLACLFEKNHGILDAHVEKYYFGKSLAGVMQYHAKFVDRPALDPSNGYKVISSGVYPFEFDQGSKAATKVSKERRQRDVATLLAKFSSDASQFFTPEYIHHYGEEITQITRHFSPVWAAQYPDIWAGANPARKRLKPGLRLIESGSVGDDVFRNAA